MVMSFKSVVRMLILIFLTLGNYLKRYGGDFSVNLGEISTSLVRIFLNPNLRAHTWDPSTEEGSW